jgi:hypothetical protein
MTSTFPGMDPFIEDQKWEDFHAEVIPGIRAALAPLVVPRYIVDVEVRVYLEHTPEPHRRLIVPDVAVLEASPEPAPSAGGTATLVEVQIAPAIRTLPMPERVREPFLMLRDRATREVVTVIEVLCPANKRAGSDGQREYLQKREEVLLSAAHLVELDLLRGGERQPTVEPLPPGDYYAIVCRERRRPRAEVYFWPLRHVLPAISIPLAGEDEDVVLNLQAVFNSVYDRAYYVYSLNYNQPVAPPLSETEAAWVQERLDAAASGQASQPDKETEQKDEV